MPKSDSIRFTQTDLRSVSDLLSEIRKYPQLSKEETAELAARVAAGDKKAEERLVNCNLRLVITIAKQFDSCSQVLELPDLIQYGTIGMMQAIPTFDPNRGILFSSYISPYIHNSIRDAIRKNGCAVKVTPAAWDEFKETYGELPLQARRRNGDEKLTWEETLNVGDDSLNADYALNREDRLNNIIGLIRSLKKKEAEAIRCRFGIGCREMQPWEIACHMHITEARVNQLVLAGIKRLREMLCPGKTAETEPCYADMVQALQLSPMVA